MKKNKLIIKKEKNGCLYHYELKHTAVKILFKFFKIKIQTAVFSTIKY